MDVYSECHTMLINVFYLILLVLHSLALLAEVPMVQSALELSAVKQRAKGVKNIESQGRNRNLRKKGEETGV